MRRIVLLATLLGCARCEPRISEPTAASGQRPTAAVATVGKPATAVPPVTSAAPSAGPCIRTAARAPVRPAPPAGADPNCPDDPTGPFELRHAKVVLPDAGASLDVEVAEKEEQRLRGLMYRTELPEGAGMLFVMGGRSVHRFWMKNTCLPLDMLFIDDDGLIVGIEENVPTMNTHNYQVGCPSRYVLEVNAGWCKRHRVEPGQHVRLEGV